MARASFDKLKAELEKLKAAKLPAEIGKETIVKSGEQIEKPIVETVKPGQRKPGDGSKKTEGCCQLF